LQSTEKSEVCIQAAGDSLPPTMWLLIEYWLLTTIPV